MNINIRNTKNNYRNLKTSRYSKDKLAYMGILMAFTILMFTVSLIFNGRKSYSWDLSDMTATMNILGQETISEKEAIERNEKDGTPIWSVYDYTMDKPTTFYFKTEEGKKKFEDQLLINESNKQSKGVIASSMENFTSSMFTVGYNVASIVFNRMIDSFDPTFNAWYQFESGQDITLSNTEKFSDPTILFNITEDYFSAKVPSAYTIYHAARIIGIIFASVLAILNLGICIFGRAESIKTSPIKILLMYGISMFSIMIAFKFIAAFMVFAKYMWNAIYTVGDQLLTWGAVTGNLNNWIGQLLVSLVGGVLAFFIAPMFFILFISLILRPIKGFIRLYCQLMEYYLAYIVLLLILPMVLPTIITPSTSMIFKSYLRMVITTTLLIIMEGLMMKVLVILLLRGIFFKGVANYIMGLAFIDLTYNMQQYASSMGLNSVQAAGSFIRSCGHGFMGMLGTMNMMSRTRARIGENYKNMGTALNSKRLYGKGMAMQATTLEKLGSRMNGTWNNRVENKFTDSINNRIDGIGEGKNYNSLSAAQKGNLSSVQANLIKRTGENNATYDNIQMKKDGSVLAMDTNAKKGVYISPEGVASKFDATKTNRNFNASASSNVSGSRFVHNGKGYDQNAKTGKVHEPYKGFLPSGTTTNDLQSISQDRYDKTFANLPKNSYSYQTKDDYAHSTIELSKLTEADRQRYKDEGFRESAPRLTSNNNLVVDFTKKINP